ncbi:MAG: HEAT repeat domain-containing protein [Byssovorax sp.]
MQRSSVPGVLGAGLACLLLCSCGGTASIRAAEQGRLDGLGALVGGEVARGELGAGDARRLASAIGKGEIARAKGEAGVTTVRELAGCARSFAEPFEDRSQQEDEVAAAALLVRIEAGLASPSEASKWLTAVPDGPRASFRKAAARALTGEDDGPRRRALFLDPYEEVRAAALTAAGLAADPGDTEPLLEAARVDPSPAARIQAIRSAGAVGGERVTLALKDLWPSASNDLRKAIASAWAARPTLDAGGRRELVWVVETQQGSPALTAALSLVQAGGDGSSASIGVIERAIGTGPLDDRLLAIGSAPLAHEPLRAAVIKALDDPDEMVKLGALGRMLETSADDHGATADERKKLLPKLLALASSETKRVALGAKLSLARVGAREVLPLLDKDQKSESAQARKIAALAYAALGELPRAALLLADADAHVRTGAACAILNADR